MLTFFFKNLRYKKANKDKSSSVNVSNTKPTSIPSKISSSSKESEENQISSKVLERIKNAQRAESLSLDLSNTELTSIPWEIFELRNLRELFLSDNQIHLVPHNIAFLTYLKTLTLHNNEITSVPPEIGKLTGLKTLTLHNNKIKSLSADIGNLTKLKTLRLDHNKLQVLPKEITKLNMEVRWESKASGITLEENPLQSPPIEVVKQGMGAVRHYFEKIRGLEIRARVSKKIEQAEKDKSSKLDLSCMELMSLPPEIENLTNITQLLLSYNMLTSLPPVLFKLPKLEILTLTDNLIHILPPEVGNLTNLKILDIDGNRINTLPSEIGNLTNLKRLYIDRNNVDMLPPEIGNLTNLKTLRLDHNELKVLPKEITKLNMEVRWESKISDITLEENPLQSPPIEIVKQGMKAVRAYYTEILEQETVQLFEAKLLVVGEGGVGKTYLMNRLVHNKINPNTISTEGIDINKWIIKTKYTDKFRANFWDFGGQEIYHSTHQFFLTKRSLYLFVWEARTDADLLNFDYWLNTIKVLSGNSPVIVIQNKIDERRKYINQIYWKKLFQNIVEYHDVSAKEGKGTNDLKDAIIRELEKLPHIGDLLPKRWMDIRWQLERLNENFISYSNYRYICAEFNMTDEQMDRLSEYYHDLGVFLNFKRNPILRNTIFLKPEWATNAVYKVIDNPQVKENYGKFHFSELGNIWGNKSIFPAEKHAELIELMKSFELCFELPTGHEYIIPELLRANPPTLDWNFSHNIRFRYVYGFMPAGVMTRFIVSAHDLVKDEVYWKDGVVLVRENTKAMIIKTASRVIEVWLDGDDGKMLLGIIRRHMDYIHALFSNLEVSEMVPCRCTKCNNNEEPYFYSYQNLLDARKQGVKYMQCLISFEYVPIEKLFGEIEDTKHEHRTAKPKHIKIFLASSEELNKERRQIETFMDKENRKFYDQNIFLDLVLWEDLQQSFRENRIQNYFNQKMLECDIVLCLFYKRVGNFTKEEFELAYKKLRAGEKPHYLYVFFKSGKVAIQDIDKDILKIRALKREIAKFEQIYKTFKSDDDLILQLGNQLDLVIPEIAK